MFKKMRTAQRNRFKAGPVAQENVPKKKIFFGDSFGKEVQQFHQTEAFFQECEKGFKAKLLETQREVLWRSLTPYGKGYLEFELKQIDTNYGIHRGEIARNFQPSSFEGPKREKALAKNQRQLAQIGKEYEISRLQKMQQYSKINAKVLNQVLQQEAQGQYHKQIAAMHRMALPAEMITAQQEALKTRLADSIKELLEAVGTPPYLPPHLSAQNGVAQSFQYAYPVAAAVPPVPFGAMSHPYAVGPGFAGFSEGFSRASIAPLDIAEQASPETAVSLTLSSTAAQESAQESPEQQSEEKRQKSKPVQEKVQVTLDIPKINYDLFRVSVSPEALARGTEVTITFNKKRYQVRLPSIQNSRLPFAKIPDKDVQRVSKGIRLR